MKRTRLPLIFGVLMLVLVILACGVPNVPTSQPPGGAPTSPPPGGVPTSPPPPDSPTSPPPAAPTAPPGEEPYFPTGIVTSSGSNLMVYAANGTSMGSWNVPQLQWASEWNVAVAGNMVAGSTIIPPIVFSAFDSGTGSQNLYVFNNGSAAPLRTGIDALRVRAAPGAPALAVTTIVNFGDSPMTSDMYLATLPNIPSAPMVYTSHSPEYTPMEPLGVRVNDAGEPTGVWFTEMAYGIGGDIVFAPRYGLFFLDMANPYNIQQFEGRERNPQGLSLSLAWYATTGGYSDGDLSLTIKNVVDGRVRNFPLLAASDRGAGYAVFSPDDSKVAWMEGSGWMMSDTPNFTATVRVGTTEGAILTEMPASFFSSVTASPSHVKPVGWLDNDNLLVEVRGSDWDQVGLGRVTISSGAIVKIADGGFCGLIYP